MADKQSKLERRAYEIWEREGRPDGRGMEHWQQAVAEIEQEEAEGSARPDVDQDSGPAGPAPLTSVEPAEGSVDAVDDPATQRAAEAAAKKAAEDAAVKKPAAKPADVNSTRAPADKAAVEDERKSSKKSNGEPKKSAAPKKKA